MSVFLKQTEEEENKCIEQQPLEV